MQKQQLAMLSAIGVGLALLAGAAAWGADDDNDDRPEQLQVLDRWVGEFDVEMTIKPGPWVTNGSRTVMKVKGQWVLNGRFVRTEGQGVRTQDGKKQNEAGMGITTYDVNRGKYVGMWCWSVLGGGADYWGGHFNVQLEQTWDAKTQTMTSVMKDPASGITARGVTRWIGKDKYEWRNVTKDADGNVVMEQIGKGVRRKK